MGMSHDYVDVPDWTRKDSGYQAGEMVKYKGNVFYANFWATEPGVGDASENGWRFHDELYDQTPHTPTEQVKIIAYIPTWRRAEGFNYSDDEMYQNITHGIVAFLTFSTASLGEFDSASVSDVTAVLSDVVNAGHRNGAKISIALGGAVDYGFLDLMTSVGEDPESPLIDHVVQNVVAVVNGNSLDGVDLDLECWWGKPGEKDQGGRSRSEGPHPAGSGLALFARKLREAMPDKLVSAAVFGTSWYGNNYDSALAEYVDWLGVMTYDLTGSWNDSPVGPHSALLKVRKQEGSPIPIPNPRNQESYVEEQQGEWPGRGIENNPILSVEDSLWYWTNPLFVNWQGVGQQLPRNKIAAGVPIYAYDFAYGKDPDELTQEVPPGYRSIRYKDVLRDFPGAYAAPNGNIKVPGATARPPFLSAIPGTYPFAHNIYLETPGTAVDKLSFLKYVGAQGVIIWELSNDVWDDGKSIIKALYRNSGNGTKPPLATRPLFGDVGKAMLRLTAGDLNPVGVAQLVAQSTEINEKDIKRQIMVNALKPAAFLAHLLGYGWCGGCEDGKPGFVGEGFDPIDEAGGRQGWKGRYTPGCEGYMADQRLRIYFSDWKLWIKSFKPGAPKTSPADRKQMGSGPLSFPNDGSTPLKVKPMAQVELQTQTATYDLKTVKWNIEAGLSASYKTPGWFGTIAGDLEVSMSLKASGGEESQTGTVSTTSQKITLTSGVEADVPAHSVKNFRWEAYGLESTIENCVITCGVRFSIAFDGFLRYGGGITPDSNYHREYRGSEARPQVPFKFGSADQSFADDLKSQLLNPGTSKWDWDSLRKDHEPDLNWAVSELIKQDCAFDWPYSLTVKKGKELNIITLD